MKRIAVLASIAAMLLSLAAVARADELKVLSAGTMHFALKDVGDNFTRKTGTQLAITFGGAGGIKTKFEKGDPADVGILLKPDIAALVVDCGAQGPAEAGYQFPGGCQTGPARGQDDRVLRCGSRRCG